MAPISFGSLSSPLFVYEGALCRSLAFSQNKTDTIGLAPTCRVVAEPSTLVLPTLHTEGVEDQHGFGKRYVI